MVGIFTIFILIYLISISIFLGYIGNTVAVHSNFTTNDRTSLEEVSNENMIIGDAYRHLLVFIQISDIHISKFLDPGRITAFREFCNETVNAVEPDVVIASGDLTDGKYEDAIRTREFEEEWIHYRKALEDNKVLTKTLWLDTLGNHDNFNVHKGSNSLYGKYSVQGSKHNRSYMYTVVPEKHSQNPSEKYSFIGIDASLNPGPMAPWNFFGTIESDGMKQLEEFESESRNSNGTIWFGHYPTSFIVTPKNQIRELMKNAAAYLCGHLHTVYGLVEKMYTIHHNGLVELELGDFKINRRFRVAAFDHGVLTFADVDHKRWPIILLTNPKNILFNTNQRDMNLAKKSTHIRMLVFSPSKIIAVAVQIDNHEWINCTHVKGSLYVIKWVPELYFQGIHHIHIHAKDENGNESRMEQYFAFDNSSMSFSLLGRLALMMNAVSMPYMFYFGSSILVSLPWVIFRLIHELIKVQRLNLRRITRKFGVFATSIFRKLCITATVNRLFIPLVIGPLYFPVGPWFVGNLLDSNGVESKGIAFAWGTIVEKTWLPAAFGYILDGCVQLFWFHVPFTLVLSHCVDRRFRMLCWNENLNIFWNNFPLFFLVIGQIITATTFSHFSGLQILFLGELKKFSVIYGSILWLISATLQKSHFRNAASVWKNSPQRSEDAQEFLYTDLKQSGSIDYDHDS